MHIILLFCYITIITVPFGYCIDYYLKIGGTDSTSCISYEAACGTLDYIMTPLLNNTNGDYTIYIDTDIHNYTLVDPVFGNVVFTLAPYIFPSFSSSDIDTYPVILTNKSTGSSSPFLLYDNISSSFHYLKFLIGNASYDYRYFIRSFCFYLFFIYIYIL
jgi:hypothetical protein